jgi:hypothetical protein
MNSFLVFKNLAKTETRNCIKTDLFGFYPVSKSYILKNEKHPDRA